MKVEVKPGKISIPSGNYGSEPEWFNSVFSNEVDEMTAVSSQLSSSSIM